LKLAPGPAPAAPARRDVVAAAAPPAARTLVIGYGSPIRGDDAIGPLAAEALAAQPLPPGLTVLARHVLTAELAEDLAAVDRVIFLDAESGATAGTVRVRELQADASRVSTMAHFHDPRELLAWCETLYGRAPRAWLVTAAGASFDYTHCRLSPAADTALAIMLAEVRRLLGEGPAPAARRG
jgi:hydrogenase maturation protease